jgi:opacity protein-like surface antigen
MRKSLALAVLLLLAAGTAFAQQDYPTVETSPAFMYIRTPGILNGSNAFNCVGGGGTLAYNFSSVAALAFDGGGCKVLDNNNTILNGKVNGNEFTFLFGPRFTYRSSSKFQPFFEVNFGGMRVSVSCNSSAPNCVAATGGATYSKTAFAATLGGGVEMKLSRKFSLRLVQAEYLYTRFGNSCSFPVCGQNNHQNSFRLKSGIVIGWGGSAK